jgi:O-antigen ligase
MLKAQTINSPALPSKQIYLLAALILICALLANFFPIFLLLPIAAVFCIYFWKHQDYLVLFLIAYTPFEEVVLKLIPDQFYSPVRFLWEGLLFGFMFILLFDKLAIKKRWHKSPLDLPVIIFLAGWVISGLVNSTAIDSSLANLKNLIRYIPLFYIIYNFGPRQNFLSSVMKLIIAMAVIQSLICLLEAFDSNIAALFTPKDVIVGNDLIRGEDIQLGTYYTRFSGTLVRNVHLGNYLAFALCFITAIYLRSNIKRWLKLSALLIIAALFISSSRISWLSAFVGVGAILVVIRHRFRFYYWLAPAALMLGATLVGQFTASGDLASDFNIMNRFFNIFSSDYFDTISSAGRLYAIFYAIPAVFMANPILGLGPGAFIQISKQFSAADSYGRAAELGLDPRALNFVHDVGYASLFAQVGIIGLGAIIWIFVRLFKQAKRSFMLENDPLISSFMLGAIGFIVALAAQNWASFNLMYRNQSILIWTIAGLIAVFARPFDPNKSENDLSKVDS